MSSGKPSVSASTALRPRVETLSASKLAMSPAQAQILAGLLESAIVVIKGIEYRENLSAVVRTLQAQHRLRREDVYLILDILDQYGDDMQQTTRDQYYRAILAILTGGITSHAPLPLPPGSR